MTNCLCFAKDLYRFVLTVAFTGLYCVVITHLLTMLVCKFLGPIFRCTVSHMCRILELLLSAYSAALSHRALVAQDLFLLICNVVWPRKHNDVLFDTSLLFLSAILFSSSNLTKLALKIHISMIAQCSKLCHCILFTQTRVFLFLK